LSDSGQAKEWQKKNCHKNGKTKRKLHDWSPLQLVPPEYYRLAIGASLLLCLATKLFPIAGFKAASYEALGTPDLKLDMNHTANCGHHCVNFRSYDAWDRATELLVKRGFTVRFAS
jgi:hypothetical protein